MLSRQFEPCINILLIEDTLGDVALLHLALGIPDNRYYQIARVPDMAGALSALRAQPFDIALLDLFLPDTDGLEGLYTLMAQAPGMPVLLLSGRDDEALAAQAIERGAQDYLMKDKINGAMLKRSIRHAIQRKQHEAVMTYRAHFDPLTGLPNREYFRQRLELALQRQQRSGQEVGLMLLDLNGFKDVNDRFGHAAGDALLKQVGRRLSECIRPYDLAARLGGDEFVLLIEGGAFRRHYASLARKLVEHITRPVPVRDKQIAVGVSIGVACCDNTYPVLPDRLLAQADEAMYCAKSCRQSDYRLYGQTDHAPRVGEIEALAGWGDTAMLVGSPS